MSDYDDDEERSSSSKSSSKSFFASSSSSGASVFLRFVKQSKTRKSTKKIETKIDDMEPLNLFKRERFERVFFNNKSPNNCEEELSLSLSSRARSRESSLLEKKEARAQK